MAKVKDPNGAGRPSQEAIAKRAYELYLQRGSISGYELDDWLQAEAELTTASISASTAGDGVDGGREGWQPEAPPASETRRPSTRERSTNRRTLRQ
jgi:hypothetical protein